MVCSLMGITILLCIRGFGKLLVLKWWVLKLSLPPEGGPLKTIVARVKMLKKILHQGCE